MFRYCLACDLVDDPLLIEEYKAYHKENRTWPEITESVREAGILDMENYSVVIDYSW